MLIEFLLNGHGVQADAPSNASLLQVLRDHLQLFGSKNACEQGECGSCSVWMDGELVCACLVLAAQAGGRVIVSIEGLDDTEHRAIQEAFARTGAVQCGFCTPGLIVAAVDLLRADPRPTEESIREALSGNLCRCAGYSKIIEAVQLAASNGLHEKQQKAVP